MADALDMSPEQQARWNAVYGGTFGALLALTAKAHPEYAEPEHVTEMQEAVVQIDRFAHAAATMALQVRP